MNMVTRCCKLALICVLTVLSACAGMSEGPVPVSASRDARTEPIRVAMEDECFMRASARPQISSTRPPNPTATPDAFVFGVLPPVGPAEEMRIRRNNLATAYMAAADINYLAFERELLGFSRDNDLGSALATQLLSAIGAASGSRAISTAANITTGAVTGTQSAFSKSLLNQTVSVLQTHMRASRAERYAVAIGHLALPYANWNTCQALQDALAYEQAGTLNAALAAMAASATDEERHNNSQAQQAIERVAYSQEALADALRTYFAPPADEALMTARIGRAQALLTAAHLDVPAGTTAGERLMRILDGAQPAELRALAYAVLAAESDSLAKAPIVRAITQGTTTIAYSLSPVADALRAYFDPTDAALGLTRLNKAQDLLTAARLPVPLHSSPQQRLVEIVNEGEVAELRALAIAVIASEADQSAKDPIVLALTQ